MQPSIYNNRYRIESRLGNGGMAVVYLGTDTLLRRRVAIKVLREQYAADEDFVRRFFYEAQAAAKLSHPNIVNVYDFGSEDGAYFIVMELVDGETLAALIAADGVIPEPVAVDYAVQIASGLAFAHRQGLLHRDIKPANILITKDDVVKISDFGIARAVSEHTMAVTQPGMVMGSVYYVSPEQAQGLAIDETSDLYSVGVVLYQMLTGTLPFTGDSPVAVALKHVSENAPPIEGASGVSPALASIVARLLQKNPRDRFQSATELASALRDARERPTVTQAMTAGAARGDDPTAAMAAVRAPQPPPRPSAAPDRPADAPGANGRAARVDVVETAAGGSPVRRLWLPLVIGLALAVAAGYAVVAHMPFGAQRTVAVADYGGQSATLAQQAIAALGLHAKVTSVASSSVPQDRVVKQSPAAGTPLAAGGTVELFVSTGAPFAAVPDVKGFTRTDAERQLTAVKFRPKIVGRYSGDVPKDTVIDVNPAVGARAREGAVVTLTVSKGQQPATVPNVVSMTVDAARALLAGRGLKLAVVQQTESATIPENTIASQVPSDGTQADRGSTVEVVVSTGAPQASVPDVGGKQPEDAAAALRAAGFTPVVTYSVDPSNAGGNVTAQNPPPQTPAKRGSKVTMVISVPGTVPDVTGMSLDEAKKAILASGYVVGNIANTQDGAEGTVVRTEPEGNKETRPGESVEIYYHPKASP